MSHTSDPDATSNRPASVEPPYLGGTTAYPSSRTLNSSSRLSYYTEAATRRSSFQSARASIYQDTDASLAFDDASQGYDHPDLDSDFDVRSQRLPSVSGRAVSPFQPPSMSRRSYSADRDAGLETTLDEPSTPTIGLSRRRSSRTRQSVELSRPLSSLSRRSSLSGTAHEDPHHRLRDAAAAVASRTSMSYRRHSVEIDQLANSLSRASTPHGFRVDDNDDDAAISQPRSRPGSSLALRKYGQDGSFIKRDSGKDRGSILPPAGFFAPKKPSARTSTGNLLATSQQGGRSTTALSFYSMGPTADTDDGFEADRARQEGLSYRSTTPSASGHEQQAPQGATAARAPSPWGPAVGDLSQQHLTADSAGHRNSHVADGTAPMHPLEPSEGLSTPLAQPSPHSVVRMMASTDPLLPARALSHATTTAATNDSKGPGGRNVGLGLDSSAGTTESNIAGAEQRASSTSQLEKGKTQANGITPVNTATASKLQRGARNYRNHKGDNRFLLWGLLMTSGDNPLPFILSYLLLLVLGGLFFGFEAAWLSRNISPALIAVFAYLWLQAVVNMGVTAFRDPGILPRNLDSDPPCVLGDTPFEPGRQAMADPEDPMAMPVQRVLRVHGQTVKVKWCETCGTYRPPRSSHCRVCDNCVENIDHHCTYLNNCIGRRNYVSFLVFLVASIGSALYVVACTAARLALMTRPRTYARGSEGKSFRQALAASPVSAVLFVLSIAAVVPLVVLLAYHVRLVLLNRSTVEQIRINTARQYGEHREVEGVHGDDASVFGAGEKARGWTTILRGWMEKVGVMKPRYRDPNPFASRSWRTNVRNAVGWRSVQLDSWIDRRGRVRVDDRKPHPKVALSAAPAANGLEWKA